jgi:hypothetical protein
MSLRNNGFSEDVTVILFRYTNKKRYPYNQYYAIVDQEKAGAAQLGNISRIKQGSVVLRQKGVIYKFKSLIIVPVKCLLTAQGIVLSARFERF